MPKHAVSSETNRLQREYVAARMEAIKADRQVRIRIGVCVVLSILAVCWFGYLGWTNVDAGRVELGIGMSAIGLGVASTFVGLVQTAVAAWQVSSSRIDSRMAKISNEHEVLRHRIDEKMAAIFDDSEWRARFLFAAGDATPSSAIQMLDRLHQHGIHESDVAALFPEVSGYFAKLSKRARYKVR